jgi:hypothetical protein
MKVSIIAGVLLLSAFCMNAQQLQLLDRFNGNGIVNDSTITVFGSDMSIFDLTQYFTMKNNTDQTLSVNLRKSINQMNDSTSDYFCFSVKCWPDSDTTDIPAIIQPGAEDYTFASHVTHVRRFDLPQPLLPPGLSSITYTVFDNTTFPQPVEASVTVLYHLGGLGIEEEETGGNGDRGTGGMEAVVYPNPASDRITIETGECKPGNYTLILFNNQGILVQKSSVYLDDNDFTIPVNQFKAGFYCGRIVAEQGNSVSFRFQVSH